jgi:hypothetical protein
MNWANVKAQTIGTLKHPCGQGKGLHVGLVLQQMASFGNESCDFI